jgi:hypothetical protein
VVHGGLIAWPFARAGEVLAAYRDLTAAAPRELAVWLIMLRAPAAPFVPEEWHGERICAMSVCYSGDLDHTGEALAPLRALGDPVLDLLHDQPYTELQSYLDETEPRGHHYYWRTGYAAGLSDELLARSRDLFAGCPVPDAEIGFLHLGGRLNELEPDDGAVGNRDARFAFGVNGMWEPGERDADAHRRWIRAAAEELRPYSTGASYINFQTADEDEARVRATYGDNFSRLVAVKTAFDPGNVFRSNRNVAPGPA